MNPLVIMREQWGDTASHDDMFSYNQTVCSSKRPWARHLTVPVCRECVSVVMFREAQWQPFPGAAVAAVLVYHRVQSVALPNL